MLRLYDPTREIVTLLLGTEEAKAMRWRSFGPASPAVLHQASCRAGFEQLKRLLGHFERS